MGVSVRFEPSTGWRWRSARSSKKSGKARNDVAAQSLGHLLQGVSHFFLGEFVAARALLERCMGLADPAHPTIVGLSIDPYAAMLAYLALILACLGYIDQARSRMDEALSEARRLGHVHTLAHVLGYANRMDWLTRSPMVHTEEVAGSIDRARLSTIFGFRTGMPRTIVDRAWASTGRPCAAHAGAGGTACSRRRCRYADTAHVARRGPRHARAAC